MDNGVAQGRVGDVVDLGVESQASATKHCVEEIGLSSDRCGANEGSGVITFARDMPHHADGLAVVARERVSNSGIVARVGREAIAAVGGAGGEAPFTGVIPVFRMNAEVAVTAYKRSVEFVCSLSDQRDLVMVLTGHMMGSHLETLSEEKVRISRIERMLGMKMVERKLG